MPIVSIVLDVNVVEHDEEVAKTFTDQTLAEIVGRTFQQRFPRQIGYAASRTMMPNGQPRAAIGIIIKKFGVEVARPKAAAELEAQVEHATLSDPPAPVLSLDAARAKSSVVMP